MSGFVGTVEAAKGMMVRWSGPEGGGSGCRLSDGAISGDDLW